MSVYAKAKQYIESAENADSLYGDIRAILSKNMNNYPEDWQIKSLQRLADAKYSELKEGMK